MNVTAVTVTGTSALASAAKSRRFLGIYNQSESDVVYIAFDRPAIAAQTAGQITLIPLADTTAISSGNGYDIGDNWFEWSGENLPTNAIYLISAGTSSPVTIIEG